MFILPNIWSYPCWDQSFRNFSCFHDLEFPTSLTSIFEFLELHNKQHRESTEGYSKWTVEKRHDKLGKTGIHNLSINKSPNAGTESGVSKVKRSLLARHTCYKCSMETTLNSVKAKLGIWVIKLVESMIGWEVNVTSQVSECHLTFVRGRDFILLNKISVSTITHPEWRFEAFHEVS